MKKEYNLLDGPIKKTLIKMSMPLMGTAFVQIAYQLVDLIWLGKLSTEAVAAVGSVGFFMWIAQGLCLIGKTGVGVGLSQAYGKNDKIMLKEVMRAGVIVNFTICALLIFIYLTFMNNILGFFRLEEEVFVMAKAYFKIVGIGLVFTFLNPILSVTFLSRGNSVTPFKIAIIALFTNIILDPLLIFGFWIFPKMGIRGAALATVIAQGVQTLLSIITGIKAKELFVSVNYFKEVKLKSIKGILNLGVPTSIQALVHAFVGLILNKYTASFGSVAIAVYSIGSQIESISWMSAEGFSSAFTTFFGQNYGAKRFERIEEARKSGMRIINSIGLFATIFLMVFSRQLFKIFVPGDEKLIEWGMYYLLIIGPSEIFMTMEIGTTGMLNGLGLTRLPAYNGLILNVLRIPFAKIFMPIFAVNGIWMAMSLSSILKGSIITIGYKYLCKKTDGFRNDMEKYVSKH